VAEGCIPAGKGGRPRRGRKLAARLAVVAAVLGGGVLAPRLLSDGTSRYSGPESVAARDALVAAWLGCFDDPVSHLVVRRLRVVDVARGSCSAAGDDPRPGGHCVAVQAHTFFGLPMTDVWADDQFTFCGRKALRAAMR
jgi:hypothetical protein